MACARQAQSDEVGDPCLLRYYRRENDLGADGELLETMSNAARTFAKDSVDYYDRKSPLLYALQIVD